MIDCKIVSINARGLRDYHKRKQLYRAYEKKADVVFLQETHCTEDVAKIWKNRMGWKDVQFLWAIKYRGRVNTV